MTKIRPVSRLISRLILDRFTFNKAILPLTDEEIVLLDKEINAYETKQLNPDLENNLYAKNELLVSFAISKAENSQLTLDEAREVHHLVVSDPDFDFIKKKLSRKKLTQKDHNKLEFFNITKTFRTLNQNLFALSDFTPDHLKHVHRLLTRGLDIFADYLPDFTVYKSGKWRNNDDIVVGNYVPEPHAIIPQEVENLVSWLKSNPGITNTAVFHAALYALHPFNNGNKRTCRILEHLLLRSQNLNAKNLYSPSYYYHQEKGRYYKYLLASLEKHNLNYFAAFFQEAVSLSLVSVLKTAVEMKRAEFLGRFSFEPPVKSLLNHLVKQKKVQFKSLARYTKSNMARQTLVDYLQKAVEVGVITREEKGRTSFYSLKLDLPEEKIISRWLIRLGKKLPYIPAEFSP